MSALSSAGRLKRRLTDKRVVTAVKITFGVSVVVFGVVYISGRWGEMKEPLSHAKPGWLALAAVFALVGLIWAMIGTRLALQVTSGRRLPLTAAARVFYVSQLGKYIPGSVWPIVAVTAMTGRYRIRPGDAASAGLLSMFQSILTGGSLGVLVLLASGHGSANGLGWLILLVPVAAVLLNRRLVFATLNALLRLIKRPSLSGEPSNRLYAATVGVNAASWVFLGLQCWALCVALGAAPGQALLAAVGGFALAYTAGTVFIPAPAGAGVREAVLGFALNGSLAATTSFTSGSIVSVVLMSRVLLALLDFGLAGIAVSVDSRLRARRKSDEPERAEQPDSIDRPNGMGNDGDTTEATGLQRDPGRDVPGGDTGPQGCQDPGRSRPLPG